MQTFVKMMVIFFVSLMTFRLLFGRREKVDPFDEYYYYQMQNDPSMHQRIMMAH